MSIARFRWPTVLAALVVILAGVQIVPYGHAHTNPPTAAAPHWDSSATEALARRACFDCHSNETVWPAYAGVAPVSWLVVHDVNEGREKLNFSEWQRPQEDAAKASEVVEEGDMPPSLYLLMHPEARLNDDERAALVAGLKATVGCCPQRSGPVD